MIESRRRTFRSTAAIDHSGLQALVKSWVRYSQPWSPLTTGLAAPVSLGFSAAWPASLDACPTPTGPVAASVEGASPNTFSESRVFNRTALDRSGR